MTAFIVDGLRTPIGSFGGSLAHVRPDDMAALVMTRVLARHPSLDPARITDVIIIIPVLLLAAVVAQTVNRRDQGGWFSGFAASNALRGITP